MTKEEILIKSYPDLIEYPHYQMNSFQEGICYEAMEQYAKQEAIEFSGWLQFNYRSDDFVGFYYDIDGTTFETEELYTLFKQYKTLP